MLLPLQQRVFVSCDKLVAEGSFTLDQGGARAVGIGVWCKHVNLTIRYVCFRSPWRI